MRIFLVDFLPSDVRSKVNARGQGRRTGLLLLLLSLCVVGVGLHSWDQARRAASVREVSLKFRENAENVDELIAKLEAERSRLGDYMSSYRSVALPMEASDLIATITNLMPKSASLTDLSLKLVTREGPATGKPATPAPVAAGAPPAPPPTHKVLDLRLRGFAAGNAEITTFERTLGSTVPFTRVTLTENKSLETPDGHFQEFVITAEIPLDRKYEPVHGGGQASEGET